MILILIYIHISLSIRGSVCKGNDSFRLDSDSFLLSSGSYTHFFKPLSQTRYTTKVTLSVNFSSKVYSKSLFS